MRRNSLSLMSDFPNRHARSRRIPTLTQNEQRTPRGAGFGFLRNLLAAKAFGAWCIDLDQSMLRCF
jgi:hypothetical protein